MHDLQSGHRCSARALGAQPVVTEFVSLQEALQKSLAEYQEVVHRPPTEEDGPPVKMRSPTRKRHRLALSSSPKADTAIAAAGDLAAEAVLQAAAAAKTPEEAVAAAEQAAKVVKDAAAEAVGVHASPPARGGKTNKAENTEVRTAHKCYPSDAMHLRGCWVYRVIAAVCCTHSSGT